MSEQLDHISSTPTVTKKKRRPWWVWVLGFILGLVLLIAAGTVWLLIKINAAYLNGFAPWPMAVAQYTPKDVVGDLGGMKVTIPRHIPELVEYNGDPRWGEKRQGPRPQRTHDSKIASFGFDLRYPDMATLSSPELRADKKKQKTFETMWIGVTVGTGEIYPRDGALDSRAHSELDKSANSSYPWYFHYTKLYLREKP